MIIYVIFIVEPDMASEPLEMSRLTQCLMDVHKPIEAIAVHELRKYPNVFISEHIHQVLRSRPNLLIRSADPFEIILRKSYLYSNLFIRMTICHLGTHY